MALIAAVCVAAASAGILYMTMHFTRRQVHTVHDQRAFYLAEAGLSEAYQALASGQSGQIGSRATPAAAGEGLLWVDATSNADGTVLLESTALAGLGRSALSLVVERVEQPLGIFSHEALVLDGPVLVDGYDSQVAPYESQVVSESAVKVPKSMVVPDTDEVPPYEGALLVDLNSVEFLVVGEDLEHYYLELFDVDDDRMYAALWAIHELYGYDAPIDTMPVDWTVLTPGELTKAENFAWNQDPLLSEELQLDSADEAWALDSASGWTVSEPLADTAGDSTTFDSTTFDSTTFDSTTFDSTGVVEIEIADPIVQTLGAHTPTGGRIASNGAIDFTVLGSEIYGDVIAGPQSEVLGAGNAYISGSTSSRPSAIELAPVSAPAYELQPALVHGGLTPLVIPPSEVGYLGLTVRSDAQVTLRGPSTLLVGSLVLEDRAHLLVDNLGGPVDVFVTTAAQLAAGSSVEVLSRDPSQLTLRFVGDVQPLELSSASAFHGMVYGPGSAIAVGSDFEVFGALIGRALDLAPGVRLHFDSGLGGAGGRLPLPKLVAWDVSEIPAGLKDRRDAFVALGLDRATLVAPADAVQTNSWTARLRYPRPWGDGEDEVYEGPFEEWDPKASSGFPVLEELTPPDVEFATPWTVDVEYSYLFEEKSYVGDLADLPAEAVAYVLRMTITPPDALLDSGREPIHWVR